MAITDMALYTLGAIALNYLVLYKKNKLMSGIILIITGFIPMIIQTSAGVTQYDLNVSTVFALIIFAIGILIVVYEFAPTTNTKA